MVTFVSVTGAGVATITDCDKIEPFKVAFSILLLLCLPIGYFMFRMGVSAYFLLIMFAVMDAIWRCIHLIMANKIFKFDSLRYIREVYWPAFKISILTLLIIYFSSFIHIVNSYWHFVRLLLIFLLSIIIVLKIGLTKSENDRLVGYVKSKWNTYLKK